MYVIIEDRELVVDGFNALFGREGVSVLGVASTDALEWLQQLDRADVAAIEAVLVGECDRRAEFLPRLRSILDVPVVALLDAPKLGETLALLDAGYDDVLRKPVHVREIIARVGHVRRRSERRAANDRLENFKVVSIPLDGRAPHVAGRPFPLPRREQRILEYLCANEGRRVSKSQLFAAVYGLEGVEYDETVIESHVSKLRKKLRRALGFDPINSQRFLGYQFELCEAGGKSPTQASAA